MDGTWFNDFWRFAREIEAQLGPRPLFHELDRIDGNGHYTLHNVRWLHQTDNQGRPASNSTNTKV